MPSIPSLTRWGLSPDADIIYRTLVLYGARPSSALAKELGLSRHRVERALCDLRDAGGVENSESGSADVYWTAAAPAGLLDRLSRQRRQPRRFCAPPRPPVMPAELGPGLIHLPTREVARLRMGSLVTISKHEHLAMNPEARFDAASLKAATPMDRMLLSRGVKLRILGVSHDSPGPIVTEDLGPAVQRAAYREVPQVPMKLFVVDRKVAFFPVNPADFEQGYLEVQQEPIVQSLLATFEQHWAQAHDPTEELMPHFNLTPREEAVVNLLTCGHTDAGTARELRISERSVSAIVRSIMDRLGVDNRFQLGVALGSLRAVPPPPSLRTLPPQNESRNDQ